MAEIELSALARQCLSRRMGTQEELEREVLAWQQHRNEEATIVNWRFTTLVAAGESQVLIAEDLRVDLGGFKVTQGDREIKLGSPLLFDLLVYLLRHRGMALTREQIFQQVWGSESAIESNTLDVHVHWLRQKLQDDPTHPRLIQTVPGVGYRFTE